MYLVSPTRRSSDINRRTARSQEYGLFLAPLSLTEAGARAADDIHPAFSTLARRLAAVTLQP